MKTKLSGRFWFALTLFSLIGQVAWVVENMYFNVFIYKMFNATAADISAMVAASAIAATLTTVFMGALSDRIGKRKLFMCAGYILWGISIFSFIFIRTDVIDSLFPMVTSSAVLGVQLVIIMDCVMTFFGSTANDAAFNAWVTDSTDATNRGSVEGINSMMPLLAILVVFGGFMFFDLEKSESWTAIFAIIGITVFAIGILGCFLIKDTAVKPSETGYLSNIIYGFRPSTAKANPRLYISLAAFIVFNISIQIFMPYLIIYYEQTLKMSDYVLIMAPAIVTAAVFTAFWGKVYDKKGFKFSVCCAVAALAVGYIVLYLTRTSLPVFIGSLLMMCGYLAGMAVFGALIRDNTPQGKAGRLQGIRIFSQVLIPGIAGPAIGAWVLRDAEQIVNNDGTTSFLPSADIFTAALAVLILLIPLLLTLFRTEKPEFEELHTPFEKDLSDAPWQEYPRPQLKRDSYINLNGYWELTLKNKKGELSLGRILVPFVPESRISGIGRRFSKKDILVYSRSFELPDGFMKDRLLLHFGAVDQSCRVLVNGSPAGSHEGGYTPFVLDITESVTAGINTLTVEVSDPLDTELPYGKQREKRGGMWYTPTSGIWQTVWMESVCENYIQSLRITPDTEKVTIEIAGGEPEKLIYFAGREYRFTDSIEIAVDDPVCWTPDTPKLYEFSVVSGNDRIDSYFALRKTEVIGDKILINGKPQFFHGLLDQGYFSDGIFLPATPDGFKNDILTMKKLGFNMLRKHIKLEPDLFYYYCDKYGMFVFQDLINSGKYSFLIDTALPTVGLKKGITHKASPRRKAAFEETAEATLAQLYNHPSVVYYTLFNEGWGQYDAERLYRKMKAVDPTRVWDATSGWFRTGESDVLSEHIYFKPLKLKGDGRPLVLSEFGGYSYKAEGHVFNKKDTYGYKFYNDISELEKGLLKLYTDEVLPAVKDGLSAAVLTQVSDVEDETNGLFTYDRQVLKVDEEQMRLISEKLFEAFKE